MRGGWGMKGKGECSAREKEGRAGGCQVTEITDDLVVLAGVMVSGGIQYMEKDEN